MADAAGGAVKPPNAMAVLDFDNDNDNTPVGAKIDASKCYFNNNTVKFALDPAVKSIQFEFNDQTDTVYKNGTQATQISGMTT